MGAIRGIFSVLVVYGDGATHSWSFRARNRRAAVKMGRKLGAEARPGVSIQRVEAVNLWTRHTREPRHRPA